LFVQATKAYGASNKTGCVMFLVDTL